MARGIIECGFAAETFKKLSKNTALSDTNDLPLR